MLLPLLLACADEKAATPAGTTWNQDVAPLVQEHCSRCHGPGLQAPDWFSDPANAQAMSAQMLAAIDAGRMPPPAPDPTCRDYQDSDAMVLDDAEKAVFTAWVAEGAAIGDPADGATIADPPEDKADIEFRAPAPLTPAYDETGNAYACYAFTVEDDFYAQRMVPLTDNPRILHHIVMYDATSDVVLPDDGTPFDCPGFGRDNWDFLVGWAPGGQAIALPDTMGMRVQSGTRLVLQFHYYASDDAALAEADASGFGFDTIDAITNEVFAYPLGVYSFRIRADEEDYTRTMEAEWPDTYPAIDVIGVFPHMHQLGSGFDMTVTHPDASETCLVKMDGWDFHNQAQAFFLEPAPVDPGDVLTLTCHWDNSASNPAQFNDPPETVNAGEGSFEEMCFGFTYGYLRL